MTATISIESNQASKLREFLASSGIDIEVTVDGQAQVSVIVCYEPTESSPEILYSGGWINCEQAFALAGRLSIGRDATGKLLDHLNVKVRSCQLGCF